MFLLVRSLRTAWALFSSLNFSAASGLSGFLSGWYRSASFLTSHAGVSIHVLRSESLALPSDFISSAISAQAERHACILNRVIKRAGEWAELV